MVSCNSRVLHIFLLGLSLRHRSVPASSSEKTSEGKKHINKLNKYIKHKNEKMLVSDPRLSFHSTKPFQNSRRSPETRCHHAMFNMTTLALTCSSCSEASDGREAELQPQGLHQKYDCKDAHMQILELHKNYIYAKLHFFYISFFLFF